MKYSAKNFKSITLCLLLIGATGISWTIFDKKSEKRSFEKHNQMLENRITNLDKIISGQDDLSGLSEVADNKWEADIEKYQKRRAIRPLIKSASTGSIALGGLLMLCMGGAKLYNLKRHEKYGLLKKFNNQSGGVINQPGKASEKTVNKTSEKKIKGIKNIKNHPVTDILSNRSSYDFQNINTMYCDEKTVNSGRSIGDLNKKDGDDDDDKAFDQFENIRNSIMNEYSEHVSKVDQTLKEKSESLERQVIELKEMAESVKSASNDKPAGEDSVLSDLAQQISAIREYASQQQNRNDKLQEGYDWNIIKNFCLRIIRCIDNIENRIVSLEENDIETGDLKDIRDELIFSLESSGVEQFNPEINSDYSGLEKYAEVMKEKVASDGQSIKGKIAEVIRPGYQYTIDEDNIRVVRTARVKLFD